MASLVTKGDYAFVGLIDCVRYAIYICSDSFAPKLRVCIRNNYYVTKGPEKFSTSNLVITKVTI